METVSEVKDLIIKGKENGFNEVKDESGNIIRRFVDAADDTEFDKVMEEFDASGVLKRSTDFSSDDLKISSIKEFIDSTGKKYDGIEMDLAMQKPFIIYKGAEELADGSFKGKKFFEFEYDDKVSEYCKDFEVLADGSWKAKKDFEFDDDGKLSSYDKNYEAAADKKPSPDIDEDDLFDDDLFED